MAACTGPRPGTAPVPSVNVGCMGAIAFCGTLITVTSLLPRFRMKARLLSPDIMPKTGQMPTGIRVSTVFTFVSTDATSPGVVTVLGVLHALIGRATGAPVPLVALD